MEKTQLGEDVEQELTNGSSKRLSSKIMGHICDQWVMMYWMKIS
jgi:hypothetical protein